MANKSQYRTKQMAEILSYLQSMQGSPVTVHDIQLISMSKNISVGTTTILLAFGPHGGGGNCCQICCR